MIIVDSHCHLDMLEEHDSIDNIINRAQESGVKYLQTICTRLDQLDKVIAITAKHKNVFASAGVHPSEVSSSKSEVVTDQQLLDLCNKHKKIIGIGETGLDYYYNKDKQQLENQRQSFAQHIIASQQNQLPVIVHTRDAEEDSATIIKEHMKQKQFPALIHCFTASADFARQMLDLGLYISISGIVTFKNAKDLQEIVKFIPLERILVETDSPYLAPVPMRGKTNEPSYTKYVVEYIAELKGLSAEKVAQTTTDNFFKLFTNSRDQ